MYMFRYKTISNFFISYQYLLYIQSSRKVSMFLRQGFGKFHCISILMTPQGGPSCRENQECCKKGYTVGRIREFQVQILGVYNIDPLGVEEHCLFGNICSGFSYGCCFLGLGACRMALWKNFDSNMFFFPFKMLKKES